MSASKRPESVELVSELLRGQIDRRRFVRDALLLGLSVSAIGSVLSACGGEEKPPPPKEGDKAADKARPADAPMDKELNIYIWSDYLAPDTVPNFEKEFGVKVVVDTYESNEEAIAKLQSGASAYDLVCPSGYAVEVMVALNLIAPLDRAQLPNFGNLAPRFQDLPYDPGAAYVVPWMWGLTGLAYRKDRVQVPVDSWGIFHNTSLKGKMTQMDDMRDVIGGWLKFRGRSLNSTDPAELAQAKADALLAKANLQSYVSAPVKSSLIAGDVLVAMLWDGDTRQAAVENPEIVFAMPKEGGPIWTDNLVMPTGAPHKRAAHAFLNYVLRPEVSAAVSTATGYATPNAGAQALLPSPVRPPEGEAAKGLEYSKDLGTNSAAWDQIWTEIKAG